MLKLFLEIPKLKFESIISKKKKYISKQPRFKKNVGGKISQLCFWPFIYYDFSNFVKYENVLI